MGEIRRQSVKGSIYLYLGVILGFVTAGPLWTRILKSEEIGLFNILIAQSLIFSQFASLGFNNVTTRLFPYFRTSESSKHNGFLSLAFLVNIAGLILTFVAFYFLKPIIIENNIEKSSLFTEYFFYLIPLIVFTTFFTLLDTYSKMLYNTVLGIMLKEFALRVLNLVLTFLYFFKLINFDWLVFGYVFINCTPAILIYGILAYNKQVDFNINFSFITKELKSSILNVSLFGIIGGFSSIAITTIDKIMINEAIDLTSVGIYSTAILFGTIISIPSRSIVKISTSFIADAWKSNDLKKINDIYYKTCLNQLIFGSLIFINLWANIHNVPKILTPEYEAGTYVILFFALSNLFDMATGANGVIIQTSKYYKVQTLFIAVLMILVVITNLIFIPKFGINGAAFATALSNFIFNLLRYLFILFKFKLQPFNNRFFIVIVIAVLSYFSVEFIPIQLNFIIDIAIRCSIMTAIFAIFTLISKVSEDINERYRVYIKTLSTFIKDKK